MQRLSEYRVMWVMIFFDLPTNTVKEKRTYTVFRKDLMKDGFTMFQFSIYVRHCASRENADVHVKRVKSFMPRSGKVCIMVITDKQFGDIEVFSGTKPLSPNAPGQQLELFWNYCCQVKVIETSISLYLPAILAYLADEGWLFTSNSNCYKHYLNEIGENI